MSEHTPGPWESDERAMRVWATDTKGKFLICDIRGWGHLTGHGHGALALEPEQAIAIQRANARLIAAAPDLLECLRDLLAACTAEVTRRGGGGYILARMHDARAAIAKAEGRADDESAGQ